MCAVFLGLRVADEINVKAVNCAVHDLAFRYRDRPCAHPLLILLSIIGLSNKMPTLSGGRILSLDSVVGDQLSRDRAPCPLAVIADPLSGQ